MLKQRNKSFCTSELCVCIYMYVLMWGISSSPACCLSVFFFWKLSKRHLFFLLNKQKLLSERYKMWQCGDTNTVLTASQFQRQRLNLLLQNKICFFVFGGFFFLVKLKRMLAKWWHNTCSAGDRRNTCVDRKSAHSAVINIYFLIFDINQIKNPSSFFLRIHLTK